MWSCGKPNPHFSLFLTAAPLSLPSEMPWLLSLMLKSWILVATEPWRCPQGAGEEEAVIKVQEFFWHCGVTRCPEPQGNFPLFPLTVHRKYSIQEIMIVKCVVFVLPLYDSSHLGWLQSDLQQPKTCPNGYNYFSTSEVFVSNRYGCSQSSPLFCFYVFYIASL